MGEEYIAPSQDINTDDETNSRIATEYANLDYENPAPTFPRVIRDAYPNNGARFRQAAKAVLSTLANGKRGK